MDKDECIVRLHLLGFDTASKPPPIHIHKQAKTKYYFVFTKQKKTFIGYLTSSYNVMTPSYFNCYEHMIAKALELNANDKN